ncbi:MAG TPA: DUF4136 domain-containing protein [Polyangiaceae bacterium]|nr:DUF4136 domain-containing protein [Polyangiaceae bacterium]
MNPARVGQAILVLAVGASCAAPPPDSDRDQSIVITKHAPTVDFPQYRTFFLRPEIRTFADEGEGTPIDSAKAQPLLDATERNLIARGFTAAPKAEADLAVEMLYTEHISTTYWCYSWYDPYYWGYPGGYYPYYGCDTAMWKSNMLSTTISDLTEARAGSAGGEAGTGGQGSQGDKVPGIWFSGIYGIAITTPQAIDGIDQAFSQSPYIQTVP